MYIFLFSIKESLLIQVANEKNDIVQIETGDIQNEEKKGILGHLKLWLNRVPVFFQKQKYNEMKIAYFCIFKCYWSMAALNLLYIVYVSKCWEIECNHLSFGCKAKFIFIEKSSENITAMISLQAYFRIF